MVDQTRSLLPSIRRPFQSVENRISAHRSADAPSNDLLRKDINHERDVGETGPGRHLSKIEIHSSSYLNATRCAVVHVDPSGLGRELTSLLERARNGGRADLRATADRPIDIL
jgi:hypothetical protein